jgi:hypothetical protein
MRGGVLSMGSFRVGIPVPRKLPGVGGASVSLTLCPSRHLSGMADA